MLAKTNKKCFGYYKIGGQEFFALDINSELELIHKTILKNGETWYFSKFGKIRFWINYLDING